MTGPIGQAIRALLLELLVLSVVVGMIIAVVVDLSAAAVGWVAIVAAAWVGLDLILTRVLAWSDRDESA